MAAAPHRFKLDENVGARCRELLVALGHDVATVPSQKLSSADDRTVIAACKAEDRCLVTLDLDFGNTLLFDPRQYAGIVVLRLPNSPSPNDLETAINTLAAALEPKQLWAPCGSSKAAGCASISSKNDDESP